MNMMRASNEWASRPADQRFTTLEALRESVHNRRMRSRATDITLSSVTATCKDGELLIDADTSPATPSHWAFGQLAGAVGAPANYLRGLPADLMVANLDHGLQNASTEAKLMQVETDAGPNILQAVTSPTYGRIWDADVVDAVIRLQERTGGKFFNPKAYNRATGVAEPSGLYASDRDVFMFLIDGGSFLDGGDRAQLHRGFYVSNSEVGKSKFTLVTFLHNGVCGNHIIWGARDVNTLEIIHRSGAPTRFDREAAPALLEYINADSGEDTAAIKKAVSYVLPEKPEDLRKLADSFSISKKELTEGVEVAKQEEGDCKTLWQLVQGLTAYARDFAFIDARVDLERRAGQLLNLAKN